MIIGVATMLLLPNYNGIFQACIYKEFNGSLAWASRLSALEVLHSSCNMGTHALLLVPMLQLMQNLITQLIQP